MAEVFNCFADEYQKHRLLSFEQQKLIRDAAPMCWVVM
jgi:hypothetical protein